MKAFIAKPLTVTFDYDFDLNGVTVKVFLEDVKNRRILIPKYKVDGNKITVVYPNRSGIYRIGVQVFIGDSGSDIIYSDAFEWKSIVPPVKNLTVRQ